MKKLFFFIITIFIITSCTVQDNNNGGTSTEETTQEIGVDTSIDTDINENISQVELFEGNELYAFIDTNFGEIQTLLYTNEAPKTAANFAIHAFNGYYDNLTFHRVIDNFMIQGGDPMGTGVGGDSIYGSAFEDEFFDKIENKPGTLSMANSGVNTNGSQFFINEANNNFLDGKHSVFGEVIQGMDIVDSITQTPVDTTYNKPSEDVIINNIKLYTKQGEDFVQYEIKDIEQEKINAINNNAYLSQKITKEADNEKALKMKADKTREVKSGDIVGVKYNLTLNDGTQVDGNFERDTALEFTIDADQVVPGFNNAVKSLKIGEKESVKISAAEGYGEYDENSTEVVPMSELQSFIDGGVEIVVGNVLPTNIGEFEILEVDGENVTINTNHPLAGQELNFEIQLEYFVN